MRSHLEDEERSIPKLTTEQAESILDRIILFTQNAERKTSILVATLGFVFAIVLSTKGIAKILFILRQAWPPKPHGSGVLVFLFSLAVFFLLCGFIMLIRVLGVNLSFLTLGESEKGEANHSMIFFESIASGFSSHREYSEQMKQKTEDDYLNDLLAEIHINAKICSAKYRDYRYGLWFSLLGMFFLGLFCVIGLALYC